MGVFDNFSIVDVPKAITRQSVLSRYYMLIPYIRQVCDGLIACNIYDSDHFFIATVEEKQIEKLAKKTGVGEEYFHLLRKVLYFQRFKPIRLRTISSFSAEYVSLLAKQNITTTESLLHTVRSHTNVSTLAHAINIPVDTLYFMVCIADLMRLPGVKNIRSTLYFHAGLENMSIIANRSPEEMLIHLQNHITKHQLSESPPLRKEVTTQILWARLYPKII